MIIRKPPMQLETQALNSPSHSRRMLAIADSDSQDRGIKVIAAIAQSSNYLD
jgi:hypothetical protein